MSVRFALRIAHFISHSPQRLAMRRRRNTQIAAEAAEIVGAAAESQNL
jgi:hypothetical protein